MRIIIDAACALQSESRQRGIGRYVFGLLKGLLSSSAAKDHEFVVTLCANRGESIDEIRNELSGLIPEENIISYRVLDSIKMLDSKNEWRLRASDEIRNHFHASLDPDVIVTTNLFEGFLEDMSTSVLERHEHIIKAALVYDLIPFLNQKKYLGDRRARAWYMKKLSLLDGIDVVLTISESARREIVENLKRPEDDVVNISSSTNSDICALPEDHTATKKYLADLGVTKPFFLHVGTYEERKNYPRLIQAFGKLAATYPGEYQLVLGTNLDDTQESDIQTQLQEQGIDASDVIVTGRMTDEELVGLYSRCFALVYPSTHEGFGLPVLEAMMCGAAVIASNSTSIPEIVELNEALFNPFDVNDIYAHMDRLVSDPDYHDRLRENSNTRPPLFTPAIVAERFIAAFESRLHQTGRVQRPKLKGKSSRYRDLIASIKEIDSHVRPSVEDLKCATEAISYNTAGIGGRVSVRDEQRANKRWHIEGPYSSTYSLALVNRESAKALRVSGNEVALKSTEGAGDFPPDLDFLKEHHPEILEIPTVTDEDVNNATSTIVCRDLYPPRVEDMTGELNLLSQYGWEESLFPAEWVENVNIHLDGITCLSAHVKKVMQDSGVSVPIQVSGAGVDHWQRIKVGSKPKLPRKRFKFLHNSSCFPRKGVRPLLEAYGLAFRKSDSVCLVIKTFSNPHNTVIADVERKRQEDPNYPTVEIISADLRETELKALYAACDALVAPSRAEGYGLPLAEAMLSGLAVIATGWSGQLDFCNDETAWLVDYDFAPADTHFAQTGSVWADPKVHHLSEIMRTVFETPKPERNKKAKKAQSLLLESHKWSDVAQRLKLAVEKWEAMPAVKGPKIGWISRWNTQCGIATYSEHFLQNMPDDVLVFAPHNDPKLRPDEDFVIRAWDQDVRGASTDELEQAISDAGIETLVIQWNYAFFDFGHLNQFLLRQRQAGRQVILFMHATVDPAHDPDRHIHLLQDGLNTCERVIVHSFQDLNRLKNIGVDQNTVVFPHGIIAGGPSDFQSRDIETFTISTYGFCLPHKGLLNLVEAFKMLAADDETLRLRLMNAEHRAPISGELLRDIEQRVEESGVADQIEIISDFLPDSTSMLRLQASDLIVFPYEDTGESASGAARFAISSGRPVAVTPVEIFHDIKPATFELSGTDPTELSKSLRVLVSELRDGTQNVQEKQRQSQQWRRENTYERLARRLFGMLIAYNYDRQSST